MDKSTLSNYGWIVIAVLVLAVMIALATPFGSYIKTGVENTTQGLFDTSEKAMNVVGMSAGDGSFDSDSGSVTSKSEGSATFSKKTTDGCTCYLPYHNCFVDIDPITLTWEELKLAENGEKYNYDVSTITNTSINSKSFYYCRGLTNITIPDGITTIGESAFSECENLTNITIPDSVTSVGNYAFNYCTALTNISIPNNITTIGEGAFSSCKSLTNITIPNNIKSIGNQAFYECTSLTSIAIPDGITTIGTITFGRCKNLTNITIPDSITTIGESAFINCINLTTITFKGTKAQWDNVYLHMGTYEYKTEDWNYGVPATVVHCTDGDITL